MRVLVTGGVRSGKSVHAEGLFEGRAQVTYVAAGPTPGSEADPDWAARVRAHEARRPATWSTVETLELAAVLREHTEPLLVDCLGTWLTGVLDEANLWEAPPEDATAAVRQLLDQTVAALQEHEDVVIVTNEVGLGVVPEHRSGRLFRDLLGTVNQHFAAACDEVHLVIAGRTLVL